MDLGIEYEIKAMKYAKNKYEKKLAINTNFKGEVVDMFEPKRLILQQLILKRN